MSTPNCFPGGVSENVSLGLFGPQVTRWTQESLLSMQSTLLQNEHFRFLSETLTSFPSLWSSLEERCDLLKFVDPEKLQTLHDFAAGKSVPDPKNFSNIQWAALTVIDHVIDFVGKSVDVDDVISTAEALRLPNYQTVQGFCIGFLTAAAVSSSLDWADFERNASNSLRLAVCIGAFIDVEDQMRDSTGRNTALSVRWKTDFEMAYLEACLEIVPDAYISSITDEKALTITVQSREESSISSRLRKVNIKANPTGIDGRFHNPKNADSAQALKKLCAENQDLQLPDAERLRLSLRSTADAEVITTGALHDVAVDLILCKQAHWFDTVKKALAEMQCRKNVKTLLFGKESFVPRSLSSRQKDLANGVSYHDKNHNSQLLHLSRMREPVQADEIAVVGMACRFPQAESVEDFWQLISSGKSAFGEIPTDRLDPAGMAREPKLANFWGNFIKNPDEFDHRFFGVSGREAKSMDPQQRLALQVAYEALESSGCWGLPAEKQQTNIGCYLGVGSVDYSDNVASENANAFSATGTLRAFISGRISHFFGWTGPSVTFDTACSSSAVAIHSACKALHNRECSIAVAGGVNVITSPILHQNLSAASFLDPYGASRAFDSSASGYCRGEGAGIVVLKPLFKAVADGDRVMGIIAGSAVNQSSNCSPITVPDSQSQRTLYQQALANGGIDPKDVTYVEAHGTGTPVGDPVEYESVRLAFTGPWRSEELFVGSVKDNIGHAEGASGAAGVIKTLLMMQHKTIAKQANFETLNPRIKYSASDKIKIPTETQAWTAQKRVALVNNYGAAGSNAAIVLRQHEDAFEARQQHTNLHSASYPIFLSAKSLISLRSYMVALSSYTPKVDRSLSNIAYNLARRQNLSFECRTAFTVSNSTDLKASLQNSSKEMASMTKSSTKHPVILCFGGQTGRHVNLSRELYDSCELLRNYLDVCDTECQALGLSRIVPSIFGKDPVEDLVALHCMLFALQYCTAKCWLDCGLEVDTLVGHSLGQITALCVADSISLKDTLRLISGRARLIQDLWGQDRGVMLSVECNRKDIDIAVNRVNSRGGFQVDFACYNGPRSFVLAGDTSSIEYLEETCRSPGSAMRFKTVRLKTTHAYHSYLTDGILPGLEREARNVEIRNPRIHVETCSSNGAWSEVTAEEITKHTRNPVYFSDAVDRIAARLPAAVWLEVGSASPIINLTRRILASHPNSANIFIPMDVGTSDATENLANAACELWKAGSRAQYWLFHPSQKSYYTHLNLPPYQFERTRHWIQYKPKTETKSGKQYQEPEARQSSLVSLVKEVRGEALFSVDTSNAVFDLATRGHTVAGQDICPASMYIELVARCINILLGSISGKLPQVEGLSMSSPLGLSAEVGVFLRLCKTLEGGWDFAIFSHPHERDSEIKHANGYMSMTSVEDPFLASRMKLTKRLARSSRTDQIIQSSLATGISGSMVYKVFSEVVQYAGYYRGVKRLTGLDNEAVGFVTIPTDRPFTMDPGVCDPISLDSFLQVAGIHINCLTNRNTDEVFMCNAIEEIFFSQPIINSRAPNRSWTVYTRYEMLSRTKFMNDIFVYETGSKDLVLIILGAKFRSVPFQTVAKTLANLDRVKINGYPNDNNHEDSGYQTSSPVPLDEEHIRPRDRNNPPKDLLAPLSDGVQSRKGVDLSNSDQLILKVREMFSDIIEIPLDDVRDSSNLNDLGIDSLLVSEVLGEIQKRFKVNITSEEFQDYADVLSLCRRIEPHSFDEKFPPFTNQSEGEQPTSGLKNGAFGKCQVAEKRVQNNFAVVSHGSFIKIKPTYEEYAEDTGFARFCTDVFPLQSKLVIQYVIIAFASLGCDLRAMIAGEEVPTIKHVPKHRKLVAQLYKILHIAGIITKEDEVVRRTATPISKVSVSALHTTMLEKFPKHTSETKLLYTTAQVLADCLSGSRDPTALIFGDSTARVLLEDVYTNAPMFKTGTLVLAHYLLDVLESYSGSREIKFLELGAGTGGTTKYLLEKLASTKHKFTYTFTDLSSSLVAAAKRKFAKYSFMCYDVLDAEKDPEPQFVGSYDVIISTNCIHATKDLVVSANNIRKMLRTDGILCLVELTRNLFWFDLVFGLLEGWWKFTDSREHVLADEKRWDRCLHAAGYQWVDWTDSASEESDILRVITASPFNAASSIDMNGYDRKKSSDSQQIQQTLTFKEVDGLELKADIYYPPEVIDSRKCLPVALMIHGGGHIMLSRNDIRQEQTSMLLKSGFIPVSIDYRLCPEVTLPEGPMTDVADALAWIRNVLPKVRLQRQDVRVDGERVVSVGWSTGGHLAMSLAWNSLSKGVRPPDAILAFYSPTDYEDPFWTRPNILAMPENGTTNQSSFELDNDIWGGLFDRPIATYNVPPTKHALGGWLAPSDPRSRIALYMNMQGRSLNVLLNGMDNSKRKEPQAPSSQQVAAVSPLAQIRSGGYATPTFIIHPRQDDLIPWEQAQRTFEALRVGGVEAELRIVEDVPHLFDVYRGYHANQGAKEAVREGYEFLYKHVRLLSTGR